MPRHAAQVGIAVTFAPNESRCISILVIMAGALKEAGGLNSRAIPVSEGEEGLISAAILVTASIIRRSAGIAYRDHFGLSPVQWAIIAHLGSHGPMTQTQIIERIAGDKGQMSRAVTALVRRKLIVREDRTWRSYELRFTAAGEKMSATVKRLIQSRNSRLGTGISAADLRSFFHTLDKIARNAEGLLEATKPKDC